MQFPRSLQLRLKASPLLTDGAPVELMLARRQKMPFSRRGWGFEIKYDGYRLLAERQGDIVALKLRGGGECAWLPELAAAVRSVDAPPGTLILDGEAAVLDNVGRSDFNAFHARARRKALTPAAVFVVFDIIAVGGSDVRGWALRERKVLLSALLADLPDRMINLDYFEEDGELMFRHVLSLELEGMVAKRLDSPYTGGAHSPDWLKIKRDGALIAGSFKRPPVRQFEVGS